MGLGVTVVTDFALWEQGLLDSLQLRRAPRDARFMDTQPSKEKRLPDELARYLNELRMRVHRYRRYGLLPEGRGTLRLRARRGSGLTCLVCGEPVLASEPEIIIECEPDPELAPEAPTYRLHHLCHVIWLTESHPKRRR